MSPIHRCITCEKGMLVGGGISKTSRGVKIFHPAPTKSWGHVTWTVHRAQPGAWLSRLERGRGSLGGPPTHYQHPLNVTSAHFRRWRVLETPTPNFALSAVVQLTKRSEHPRDLDDEGSRTQTDCTIRISAKNGVDRYVGCLISRVLQNYRLWLQWLQWVGVGSSGQS